MPHDNLNSTGKIHTGCELGLSVTLKAIVIIISLKNKLNHLEQFSLRNNFVSSKTNKL